VFEKYLKSWELVFELKDWVAPCQNGTKAYCKWCKIEIMAKKSALMKHSKSFRHEREKNKKNLLNQSNRIQSVATNFNQKIITEEMLTVEITETNCKGKQKFRNKWKHHPEFKDWILPDPISVYFARCRICQVRLRAKSHCLKTHLKSAKHLLKKLSGERVSNQHSSLIAENTNENGDMTESYVDEWVLDSSDQADSDEAGERSDKTQKYSKEWETNPNFESWILPHPDSEYFAICTCCKKKVRAEISSLTCHADTALHIENASRMKNCSKVENTVESSIPRRKLEKHKLKIFEVKMLYQRKLERKMREFESEIANLQNKLVKQQFDHKAEVEGFQDALENLKIDHKLEIEKLKNDFSVEYEEFKYLKRKQKIDHRVEVEEYQKKNKIQKIQHKVRIEEFQNKIKKQESNHEAKTKEFESELAKQQQQNKMLISINLNLRNQVKSIEEAEKCKTNNVEMEVEEPGYGTIAHEANFDKAITNSPNLTTNELQGSVPLEEIKEEPVDCDQLGAATAQQNTDQYSQPRCEMSSSFGKLQTNNQHRGGTEAQATRVGESAPLARNAVKCSTCHLIYKQLQSVFERRDSNEC